jgi:hypothetical protein
MPHHEQRLEWNHDFVVFDVVTNEHENVFASHRASREGKDSRRRQKECGWRFGPPSTLKASDKFAG